MYDCDIRYSPEFWLGLVGLQDSIHRHAASVGWA